MARLTLLLDPRGRPLVSLLIGISKPRRLFLESRGLPSPQTLTVTALVDTGASDLCLDRSVVSKLGLQPTETRRMLTASSGALGVLEDAYVVEASLADNPGLWKSKHTVAIQHDLSGLGVEAIFGRAQLRKLKFVYHGREGWLALKD
jgi:hypothetical protein